VRCVFGGGGGGGGLVAMEQRVGRLLDVMERAMVQGLTLWHWQLVADRSPPLSGLPLRSIQRTAKGL
jgi:hypothetical protein